VNPVIDPSLDGSGTLRFANAAVAAGVAKAPASYEAAWFSFDNATGESTPIGSPVTASGAEIKAPGALPSATGAHVRVDIKAVESEHASWGIPVKAFFARNAGGWKLVGFERLPDESTR
jgi:hypothetical protein